MSPRPLELGNVLSRFHVETNTTTYHRCQRAYLLMQDGNLLEAVNHAQAGLRDSLSRHERGEQAISCAYLAAVYTLQGNFVDAVRLTEDCFRLFHQMGDQHNGMVAQALLATVYQMHLEMLSRELIHPLREAHAESTDMESKALARGQIDEARMYRQQFIEFGEQVRRARWIPAIPYALPLVWLPVVDRIPSDPIAQGAEIEGYMEPVLFVLRTKLEAANEESGKAKPSQIADVLYTAHSVPMPDSPATSSLRPPRLDPNATYVAIKVDPESARMAGFEPEDYLLVRSDNPAEIAEQIAQAGGDFTGWSFKVEPGGKVQFIGPKPPQFVGEPRVKTFSAQIDAILRRVP